ncbi:MAG: 1-acyl-sn-glycerol-3-phosphate acyltransferase [Leptospiraceae bacterium]|nr:1-acyl-sn-glycerol-3-phosphate acyltransferase [Leptospiraceae bacterium]MCB1315997.1 1-acyl-sn-glycerol-3-phosphate acyltransferase [Leptospiraceae bacterium]MCB1320524.1 1-acyl-sn-glycerol-3-phosphate acyltransferase [Leptospiraceae bacterium]
MSSKYFQSPDLDEFNGRPLDYFIFRGIPHFVLDAMRAYVRLETVGLENIPRKGPVIVTPNHSGVLGWDALIVQNEILKFARRMPRTMSHNFWHSNDTFSQISNRLAYIPQDFKKAIRILRRNNLLLLFPEAEAGNFKPSTQMYQLQGFNPGFVSLAMMADAPIIPTCVIGAEEAHLNLGTLDWTEKFIGAKIPLPLNLIPLPVKWKLVFMKPIYLGKYSRRDSKNIRFLIEVAENVRMHIQKRINKELVDRGVLKFLLDG